MRFTKDIIQKILDNNEGFTKETYFQNRNFRASFQYIIENGKMFVREVGKTSWADSRFDQKRLLDLEQTRRILKKFIGLLNLDGIK